MAILNCKRLRRVVMLAGVLLVAGMFLEVTAHLLASSIDLVFVQALALVMVLASPTVIMIAVVISLLPGIHLRDCTHN